jgi:importin-5
MLDTLPSLPQSQFPKFISTLTPLTTTNPTLFQPHLRPLLGFLPALILPSADPGPTPTVAKPFPTSGSFTFPPVGGGSKSAASGDETDEDGMAMDEEREDVRKAALEFMISLSESKPAMVRKVDGWTAAIVRGCLEGMGELGDDNLDVWLEADVRIQFLVAWFRLYY